MVRVSNTAIADANLVLALPEYIEQSFGWVVHECAERNGLVLYRELIKHFRAY